MQSKGVFQNPAPEPPPHCSSLQHFSDLAKHTLHQKKKSYWKPYLAYTHPSLWPQLILYFPFPFCVTEYGFSFNSLKELSSFLPLTLLHVSPLWLGSPPSHPIPTHPSDLSLAVTSLGMFSLTPLIRSNYTVYVHCSLYIAFSLVVILYLLDF